MTGFAATLIWFLSAHGQSLYRAHLRSDALATLAFTDPLTGLLNRRSGHEKLTELFGRAGASLTGWRRCWWTSITSNA
ncbi:hypothetical protein [Deinococcus aquaticus]|uniref:hypothetical protein n=1 Tax=Deinococcus aquaticus TaxID=328692 RepID=UPI00361E8D43